MNPSGYDDSMTATQLLDELNPEQREAVEHINGPMLILAGPGSGKTRVIVYRTAHLIHNANVPPENITALTFTNKAANEMKERISSLTGHVSPQITASTFHSICSRLLRTYGDIISLERNFSIYDQQDQLRLIRECVKETLGETNRTNRISPNAILARISRLKTSFISPIDFKSSLETMFEEIVQRVYTQYELMLARQNALDFDDLLIKGLHLMKSSGNRHEQLRLRFRYLMVDEFQDTDPIQYALAQEFSTPETNLVVVGDPDQSIYSWRNADITNILTFQEHYNNARVVELKRNYRSTQNIVNTAQSLISNNSQRFKTEMITAKDKGAPVVLRELPTPAAEANFIIAEIMNLANSRQYSLNQIAVMYRTNAQSRLFEEAVMIQNIPYKLVGALPFFQRKEIKDLLAYLRLISNPQDDISLERIINVPARGIGAKTMTDLSQIATECDLSIGETLTRIDAIKNAETIFQTRLSRIQNFAQVMTELREFSLTHSVSNLIERVIERINYVDYLLKDDENAQERTENLQELLSLASSFDNVIGTEGLTQFLEHSSLVTTLDDLNENDEGVTLITLHQAKGLEFKVVFLAGLEENLLPHVRSIQAHEETGDASSIEEERRLCYVGVTRAQDRLLVTYCQQRPKPWASSRTSHASSTGSLSHDQVQPSRFIDEMGLSPFSIRPSIRPSMLSEELNDSDSSSYTEAADSREVGDSVSHPNFGHGVILKKTLLPGNDAELEIFFSEVKETKRLLMNSAPLAAFDE